MYILMYMQRYYTVYKTTNLLNGEYYIGVHITEDVNDEYLGSGVRLRRSIEKYGIENFKKEIVQIFDNPNEMFLLEANLVNEDRLSDPMCLNLTLGGHGSFLGANLHPNTHSSENQSKRSPHCKQSWREENADKISMWTQKGIVAAHQTLKEKRATGWRTPGFTGMQHTDDYKSHMSRVMKEKQAGERNSQFGSTWICNDLTNESRKVKSEELASWISKGWRKGRSKKAIHP